ncbi:hypothetical protein [Frigoriglobus tundricola]|uniref:Uncharacterized protein n=1 Tax=Frigoriglobus tundricola TaxID=2774151 RepID=A0A6M5YNJ9_9BACT|nr:hypothetical protein [Frigoriglobus tundricola]QJW94821.1 hypothetical protein FTUN_2345 [Frigoriglobus tundricola]
MNLVSVKLVGAFVVLLLLASAPPVFADCGCGGGGGRPTPTKVSGLGVGLAAIGMTWGTVWIGIRFTGRWFRR